MSAPERASPWLAPSDPVWKRRDLPWPLVVLVCVAVVRIFFGA